jgi:hypothetical protein
MRSDSLLTIALALQDLGGEHRTSGSALFERLLEFNLPYVQTLLTDLDKRTTKPRIHHSTPATAPEAATKDAGRVTVRLNAHAGDVGRVDPCRRSGCLSVAGRTP